jgi:lipopolysaccharide exporter
MSESGSLKLKTVGNLSVSAASVVMVNLAQLGTSIILARLLFAGDYGVVAYAQILINFMMQFSDFGLNSALIQRREVTEDLLYSGLSLKVLLSLGSMLLLLLASPHLGGVFGNRAMGAVVSALSLNFLFSIFSFLPQVVMMRELLYKKLVLAQTTGVCVGAGISIALAYSGYGFWSLVAGNLANNFLTAVLLNAVCPVRYRWLFNRGTARELARFGWGMVLPGIIIFVIMNFDNFLVGSFRGAAVLGFYTIAFNWGSMICTILSGIVHKVLFPTFARIQHDLEEIKKWYLKSLKYVALIAVPVNLGLLLIGREFLFWVLGKSSDRWLPSLLPLKILCLYGIARALLEPVGNVISAIGKPHYFVRATYLVAVAEIVGVTLAVFLTDQLAWVALAVLLAYLTQYAVYYRIMKAELALSLREIVQALSTAGLAGLAMAGSLMLLKSYLPFSLTGMLVQIAAGALVYTACYGCLDRWRVVTELRGLIAGARRPQ